MNNISNVIGAISPNILNTDSGLYQDIPNIDFSNILEEQLNELTNSEQMGSVNILDLFNNSSVGFDRTSTNTIKDVTTSEILTFSESVFDSSLMQEKNNPIYDFSRKNATNFYGKCAKHIAMDLEEFVSETLSK